MTTSILKLQNRGLKNEPKKLNRINFEQLVLDFNVEITIDLLLKKISLFAPTMEKAVKEYLRSNPYANETTVVLEDFSDETLLKTTCLLSDGLKEACLEIQSFTFEPGKVLEKKFAPSKNYKLKI